MGVNLLLTLTENLFAVEKKAFSLISETNAKILLFGKTSAVQQLHCSTFPV